MALIAPGIIRYSLRGDFGGAGRTWANILDVDHLGGAGVDRATIAQNYSAKLGDAWRDFIAPNVISSVRLMEIGWVDLDSEDGSTGTQTAFDQGSAPIPGGLTGDMLARNTAYLIRKGGASQRGARSGRWYVPGINEEEVGEVTISSERVDAFNSDLIDFVGQITDPDIGLEGASSLPCVVHTRNEGTEANPNIVYTGRTVITVMTCDTTMATQRRRLR